MVFHYSESSYTRMFTLYYLKNVLTNRSLITQELLIRSMFLAIKGSKISLKITIFSSILNVFFTSAYNYTLNEDLGGKMEG